MALGGEGLWCGSSLRPWQILHSRLARMHTCGLLERDLWELMDETVEAAYPLREYKKEDLQCLDGDDGELWRHGGLMEARIRDWLTSKIEQEMQEAQINVHPYYCASATYSGEFSETWDSKLEEEVYEEIAGDADFEGYEEGGEDDHSYNGANYTVATYSSEFSETWDSTLELEATYGRVVAEQEENEGYTGANMANAAATLAAPLDAETHYCSQFSDDNLQANTEAGSCELHAEEDEQLCAVCLEKLYMQNEELHEFSMINNITRLPCRHSFHSPCLSPWLSSSSFCPCCRAPISALHLEAPPNLGGAAPCSDAVHLDMMGLVAEMEAALDRFGLLS